MIEKHFILSRETKTADSFFSATPDELEAIVKGSKMVFDAMGSIDYPLITPTPQRSLIAIKEIKKSEALIEGQNFKSLRPGGGIEPKFVYLLQGRVASEEIPRGTLLKWNMIGA